MLRVVGMKTDLKTPCSRCPFRIESFFPLNENRILEIEDMPGLFPCHKTVDYSDDEGEGIETKDTQLCAGFVSVHNNQDTDNNMLRIMMRLGMLDPETYNSDVPCYESFDDYVYAQED